MVRINLNFVKNFVKNREICSSSKGSQILFWAVCFGKRAKALALSELEPYLLLMVSSFASIGRWGRSS